MVGNMVSFNAEPEQAAAAPGESVKYGAQQRRWSLAQQGWQPAQATAGGRLAAQRRRPLRQGSTTLRPVTTPAGAYVAARFSANQRQLCATA